MLVCESRTIWCSLRQQERHFFGAVYQAGDRRWGHVGPASGRADATASVPSGRRVIAHLGDSTSVFFRLAGAIGGGKTPTPLRTSKKRKPSQECMRIHLRRPPLPPVLASLVIQR